MAIGILASVFLRTFFTHALADLLVNKQGETIAWLESIAKAED